MSHLLKARVVLAALLALTTFAAAGPRAFAQGAQGQVSPPTSASFTTVILRVSGGNAAAIATCLNEAKDNGGNNEQENGCQNSAAAVGGNVTINGATLMGVSTPKAHLGKTSLSSGFLAVTLAGGSATAIASCVNNAGGDNNSQLNVCTNTAVAIGGIVNFTNVSIKNVIVL